jgi:bacterioferritin
MSAYLATSSRDQFHPFLSSVAEIRRRARQQIEQDRVSADHAVDREAVLRLLNAALATELTCVLRYRRYAAMERQALDDAIKSEFLKRAEEEKGHADQIAARMVELGGEPNLAALGAEVEYPNSEDEGLTDMLAEDLIVERIAIDTYREIVRFVGPHDGATRQLFESILTLEQEHAEGLASMRENLRRQDRAATGTHLIPPIEPMR